MQPVIQIEGIGKHYRLGQQRPGYLSLRDECVKLVSRLTSHPPPSEESFWALKNVSFDVQAGEAVGIVGRNGAGKSTLLKVLSQITPPTEGRITCRGRIASLLEVGTGFHPELTGRENIFLNGTILGMTRRDIRRRFDEIVAFSEVERFLDTPVKRYSSGMYVRLAFAVAAHLESEILIVDEVLAVGDAGFQKKCLAKIGDVAEQGRAVLLVSHNMAAIGGLCTSAALLEHGALTARGDVEGVLSRYSAALCSMADLPLAQRKDRRGRGMVRFRSISFLDKDARHVAHAVSGKPLQVLLEYEATRDTPLRNCRLSLMFSDARAQILFNCSSELTSGDEIVLPPRGYVRCVIPDFPLSGSQYTLSPFLEVNHEVEDWVEGAAVLDVEDGDFFGTGRLYPEGWRGRGVLVRHHWLCGDDSTPGLLQ